MAEELGNEFDGLRDSRFAHLLKPIRDLAENWGIGACSNYLSYAGPQSVVATNFHVPAPC